MSDKVKAFAFGSLEALAVGFAIGIGSVWVRPEDVLFTKAGLLEALRTGVSVSVIYLIAFIRKHSAFAVSQWDGTERRGLTDAERRAAARLPLAPKDGR